MADRSEIIRLLAVASHETWMRQKERDQGVPRASLDLEVTAHDIERAEDALRTLEEHGLLHRGFSRHWHKEPASSTPQFVADVPLMKTSKGLKAVVEITAYAERTKVAVASSVVEGANHNQAIRQQGSLHVQRSGRGEGRDRCDRRSSQARGQEDRTGVAVISARTHLESLVGSDVHTRTKRLSNRILRIEQDEVVVSTGKSPSGQPVPIAWVQDAFDILE